MVQKGEKGNGVKGHRKGWGETERSKNRGQKGGKRKVSFQTCHRRKSEPWRVPGPGCARAGDSPHPPQAALGQSLD